MTTGLPDEAVIHLLQISNLYFKHSRQVQFASAFGRALKMRGFPIGDKSIQSIGLLEFIMQGAALSLIVTSCEQLMEQKCFPSAKLVSTRFTAASCVSFKGLSKNSAIKEIQLHKESTEIFGLDSLDRKILWELDANCRISYEKLSQKLNLSANAARKRLEKLIEDGVILRFMVIPQNAVLDADFISILVYTDGTENQDDLIQRIGSHPVVHHVSPLVSTEGGTYHLFGQYSGIDMLSELGQFLKEIENVTEVKLYPVLFPKGGKIELTKIQLRILACLIDNPRMSISEIAQCSNLSARMVRRVLNKFQDERAIRFTVRWDINAGDNTSFWILISWDQKKMTHEELANALESEFPDDYWTSFVVATEPIVFARFVVANLRRANQIIGRVKEMDSVESTHNFVCYSSSDFPWLGETWLKEMISKIDR